MSKSVMLLASAVALVAAAVPAHASCSLNTPFIRTATFGAAADAHYGCAGAAPNGGSQTTAGAVYDLASSSAHARATASLAAGALTAWASTGTSLGVPVYAAATLWDTFTFSGLPASGGTLTAVVSLTGSMVGTAAQGGATFLLGSAYSYIDFSSAAPVPSLVSVDFTAFNGVPIKLVVELEAFISSVGTADLEDPPTFSVVVPQGVAFNAASGIFQNVGTSPVPEGPTYALMLAGLSLVLRRAAAKRAGIRMSGCTAG